MFRTTPMIAPARAAGLFQAAEAAARAIPPAFPLTATVAVNPFLGQTGEGLAEASARLARVAGVRLTRPRADYARMVQSGEIATDDLAAALADCAAAPRPRDVGALIAALSAEPPAPKPLPTVADLAAETTGVDWPALIARSFGLWAAGHFDQGQALWTPAPGRGAFAAWREWATHDLTPEIAGLTGFGAHVFAAPDSPERAILRAADRLGVSDAAAETVFHRLLMDLGGWAQHARWRMWRAEQAGETDATITDLLAIRLIWEEALLAHAPEAAPAWVAAVEAHAQPLRPNEDQVIDAMLQDAAERAHQRGLAARLTGPRPAAGDRPALQAVFCIDVRSEVFRRALESVDPGVATVGFAGFFGLPLAHLARGGDQPDAHLPVLLTPTLTATGQDAPEVEGRTRIAARALRAWGRFRQAAVSSFAFVESAGPTYGWKLLKDALAAAAPAAAAEPAPRLPEDVTAEQKAMMAAGALRAMGMTAGHAPLVLLLGHGATVANNPHESAYHCGACGGHTGEVSARLLAGLLNDPDVRALLPGHGVTIPADTLFVGGVHDTTTDAVTLRQDGPAPDHVAALARAEAWLARAGALTRAERALRLPGIAPSAPVDSAIAARAANWAEVRPEWGLAGCAAFIAAPRAATAGVDLGGRSFLHSYDWRTDEGFGTLELILTAPVVVASWIALQYYGSSVAPEAFGGGDKLIHNVVGGFGVVQGNGGVLRPGLPWQAVHDGERLIHEPLRLSVLVEAPTDAIAEILSRHDGVRALFDNGWLHLLAMEDGRIAARYRPGLTWVREQPLDRAA
jgi:uncharacterized protein YbcC (UPF0753/DUF2309 family)